MNPTTEQIRALDLFRSGDSLAIEAGAGTGKTTTLRLLAEDTTRQGAYIAFNKAIVVEAGSKFPGHVTCSTAHSLAYRAVGHRYGDRLRNSRRMRSMDVARFLAIDPVICTTDMGKKVLQPSYLAGLAQRAITRFCQTADPEPTRQHVPYVDGIDLPLPDGTRTYRNNRLVQDEIGPKLAKAWADIIDLGGSLRFEHGHYLKMWQLEGPRIDRDFILFDEAQDANPVIRAIVEAQDHAQRVYVGDSQQAIYGFTGAVNALAEVDAEHRTFLTQSFRFGQDVAAVANRILGMLHADLRLIGSPDLSSTVGPIPDPDAMLTRTNATAVQAVLDCQERGGKPHLVGGGKEVVDFAKAARDLMDGRSTWHPELACFDSWVEVQSYVQTDEMGGDLRMLVNLVDNYGVDTIVKALDRAVPEAQATLIVSTAHKAKGREWASVQLGGDFPSPKDGEGLPGPEELRLLYVAATRARMELDISAVGLLSKKQPADSLTGEAVA